MTHPAVFLDRDGVLNAPLIRDGNPHPPESAEDVRLLPLVAESCEALRGAGLPLIVVSNQPDVARGTLTMREVDLINRRLQALLGLEEIVVCPHDDRDHCECRKPKPGMILQAAARHAIDLERSVMVGDRWRDIAAGSAAGVSTVFIDRQYSESKGRTGEEPDLTVKDLHEALPWILRATAP